MRDTELYGKILGLSDPWRVVDVELDTADRVQEVRVFVANEESKLPCPECGRECPRHDTRERRWRHLDTCQYRTILVAEVPRVRCPKHKVLQARVPWADPGSRFTALFEALVIDWLSAASISAVAEHLHLSWDQVDSILQRAVERGLARRASAHPRHLGIDETSFQKRHEYVTIVSSGDRVLWVADGRDRGALDGFFEELSPEALDGIESVAMDMWGPYQASAVAHLPDPDGTIAFDKFHVVWHLNQAVDKVRRAEHRELLARGDETLKRTKYLWLRSLERLDLTALEIFDAIQAIAVKTARAWAVKEAAMELWSFETRDEARTAWRRWCRWALRTRLEPVMRVARMVQRHLTGILNAIVLGVTNARAEGVNSAIQWIKKGARGFRNRDRFRNAIYFHLGGLDLYPEPLRN